MGKYTEHETYSVPLKQYLKDILCKKESDAFDTNENKKNKAKQTNTIATYDLLI